MFGNPRTGGHVRCILLELYFKQFSLPKGDCRRCMANNLMFSTCTHAGLNWFRLLTEGQDKPLHWCGNVASWTVNMSIYCETQSHSVHWLSSPIFPCLSVSMVTSPFISIVWYFRPYKLYIFWKLIIWWWHWPRRRLTKDKYKDKDTKTQTKTNAKCLQDSIYAIFFISRGF